MKSLASQDNITAHQDDDKYSLISYGEQLKNGIWPRSVPLWMTAFYITLFIIRPWEQLFPWMADIHFHRMYALSLIAVVFFSKNKTFRMTLQSFTVLLFFAGIALSALLAIHPPLAWEPFYEYLTLIIFYFILLLVIRTPYDLIFIVISYITTMGVYLAKSQWEFFVHGQNRYDMGVVRMIGIESTFGGPNNLAMSIVVSLPMALFLWSYRKELSLSWPAFWQKWFPRFLLFYFILAGSSVILTNSRSGMVSLLFFIILSVFHGKGIGKKFKYLFLGLFVIAITWQLMSQEHRGRFETIWQRDENQWATESAEGRIEGYKAGITMFSRYPITGVGIGNFISYSVGHVDGVALNAHNLAGQVLGETGIIGGVTFLSMLITMLINLRKVKIKPKLRPDLFFSVLSFLSISCRNALFLLVFTGLFGHNLLRFNWLWLAAFSTLAVQFFNQYPEKSS